MDGTRLGFAVVFLLGAALLCACSGAPDSGAPSSGPPAAPEPAGEPAAAGALLMDQEVLRLESGDFVHPKFSPDGSLLGFAVVVVKDEMELDGVQVLDFASQQVRTLLEPEASRKYAAYGASVYEMRWRDDEHLEAEISDGDVGGSLLRFDVHGGNLLHSEALPEGDEPVPLEAEVVELMSDCGRTFPALPDEIEQALNMRCLLLVGPRRIVLQNSYSGNDQDIRLFDCATGEEKQLLPLEPGEHFFVLNGGFVVGDSIVLLVNRRSGLVLAAHSQGELKMLKSFGAYLTRPELEVKRRAGDTVYFQVRLHRPSEAGHNPVFAFDGGKNGGELVEFTDFPEIYDVDISADGKRVAMAVWSEGKRMLVVGKGRAR